MARLAFLRADPGWVLAALALALHLAVGNGYGYFRDELYFIVCGEHPAWGYVDQPPLIPLIAAAMHHLFPGSVIMLRLFPALTHAATVALTAAAARRRGGLAAGCGRRRSPGYACSPVGSISASAR